MMPLRDDSLASSSVSSFNSTALVVDDVADAIQYSNGWTQTFTGLSDFNNSYHVANKQGIQAIFKFNGKPTLFVDHYGRI